MIYFFFFFFFFLCSSIGGGGGSIVTVRIYFQGIEWEAGITRKTHMVFSTVNILYVISNDVRNDTYNSKQRLCHTCLPLVSTWWSPSLLTRRMSTQLSKAFSREWFCSFCMYLVVRCLWYCWFQSEADRTLIYITLYISECLKKLQKVSWCISLLAV